MKIDISKITERQILTIKNSINYYSYIQKHYQDDDEDFRDIFTEFYLSSQGVMRNEENRLPFFEKMHNCAANKDLIDLVKELFDELPVNKYEFSFATKLLHTVNNASPIYDSKVRIYLKKNEDVDFWLYYRPRVDVLGQIEHDWNLLVNWYNYFLSTEESKEWIEWFDNQFPEYKWINKVKKIDFIIFAFN
jgi:hypothetical protein